MRKLALSEVEPGDELAVDVKIRSEFPGVQYRLRLEADTELAAADLKRLDQLGGKYLFIKDPDTEDLVQYMYDPEVAAAEAEVARVLKEFTDGLKQDELESIDMQEALDSVNDLIAGLRDTEAMMAFTNLKSHDDYTAKHSLDVSRLTLAFVLSREEELLRLASENTGASSSFVMKYWLEDLGLGALLHDIGKWKIPSSLLTKPDKLDNAEWEAIEKHPDLGYELLQDLKNKDVIRPAVARSALTHHEQYGGDGYPREKSGENIHLHGRLTALCDVYSALTSNRPYNSAASPHKALEIMDSMQESGAHFDPEIYEKFRQFITPFPIGQEVELENDARGIVCDLEEDPEKPYVRILYRGGERLDSPEKVQANTTDGPQVIN